MFEKWRIKEHMDVTDAAGRHVGTVDSIENERIKLTRSDSGDGAHHYLDLEMVDRIDDNRVYLKQGAPVPQMMAGAPVAAGAGTQMSQDASAADFASSGPSPTQGPQGADAPLFGTSGHGTGMGGSGTS